MNDVLRDAALNASVVNINGETWHVFLAWEDEDEVNLTLAKPYVPRFSGDVSAKIEDYALSEMLESGDKIIFYPVDHEDAYIVDKG